MERLNHCTNLAAIYPECLFWCDYSLIHRFAWNTVGWTLLTLLWTLANFRYPYYHNEPGQDNKAKGPDAHKNTFVFLLFNQHQQMMCICAHPFIFIICMHDHSVVSLSIAARQKWENNVKNNNASMLAY